VPKGRERESSREAVVPVVVSDWEHGREAVRQGMLVLGDRSRSAVDAVERGIMAVEDDPLVDSVGTGGIPNAEGVGELDASMMIGNTYRCGGVSCLTETKNPIAVARKVMELSPHNMLCGEGARKFARALGFPPYEPVTPEAKRRWGVLMQKAGGEESKGAGEKWAQAILMLSRSGQLGAHGTVGVLALDASGLIVAGTSTSGPPLRLPGRVSDSSVIGAGTYATPAGASSATGEGEYAIKYNLTRRVCDLMGEGHSPTEACERALKEMLKIERKSPFMALIALNSAGTPGGATTGGSFSYYYERGSERVVRVTPAPLSA
jgi:isoaspartyl peptidase/L-asparaginase-like protein (Ntn-hydrolase superfamily)